jgi:hypothetical protein
VTRDRLRESAARAGKDGAPLVRSLLAQSLPGDAELTELYRAPWRLDGSLLVLSPEGARILDGDLLRDLRCAPLEVLPDLCVLAVLPENAPRATAAVREALRRDVLPVLVEAGTMDALLKDLPEPEPARPAPPLPRREPFVKARFRSLVEEGAVLDALPVAGGAGG